MVPDIIKSSLAGIILAFSASAASAVTLTPGDTYSLPGISSAEVLIPSASPENSNLLNASVSFAPLLFFSGQVQNLVERADDGGLIFAPRFFNPANTTGFARITRIELVGFGGYEIDANYISDGVGDRGPTSASRSADGDVITLDYGFPLNIGYLLGQAQENSKYPYLRTNATEFATTGRMSIFGQIAFGSGAAENPFQLDFTGLAVPSGDIVPASVPLPASAFLLLSGFCLILGLQRKG